jgi:thioredoxin reductase
MSGPTAENTYDVIVIGAGPVGQTVTDGGTAALAARQAHYSHFSVTRPPRHTPAASRTRWMLHSNGPSRQSVTPIGP